MQQRARQAALREREEIARRKGAKKCVAFPSYKEPQLRDIRDTKLLSFGADADEEAEGTSTIVKKKSVARPDCEWLSVSFATCRIYLDT